jgi:hypothetical protein
LYKGTATNHSGAVSALTKFKIPSPINSSAFFFYGSASKTDTFKLGFFGSYTNY